MLRGLGLFSLTLTAMAAGCARTPPVIVNDDVPLQRFQPPIAALAFTPPAGYGIDDDAWLDRDGRQATVDGGVEAVVVSETFVRQDDRYRFGRFGEQGDFERRAISTTVTVRQK